MHYGSRTQCNTMQLCRRMRWPSVCCSGQTQGAEPHGGWPFYKNEFFYVEKKTLE